MLSPTGAATAPVPARQVGPNPGDCRGEERVGRCATHSLLQQVHAAAEDETRKIGQRLIMRSNILY